MNDPQMVRTIQQENLKNLKVLDAICKRHGIRYWIAYGSLIGTMRHKGFIPWDDDIDVGMMREDFEKLCQVPKEEWLSEGSILVTSRDDDIRQEKMFGRVFRERSVIQSRKDVATWRVPGTGEIWHSSLMLDIFVFDHVTDDEEERKRIYKRVLYISQRLYPMTKLDILPKNNSLRAKIVAAGKNLYGRLMRIAHKRPWVYLSDKCDRIIAKSTPGSRVGMYYTIDPYTYSYDDIFPLEYAPYEDMTVPVPKCWEQMLSDMYGDWRTPLPESERDHIAFIYADLGNGEKFIIDPIPGSLGEKELARRF